MALIETIHEFSEKQKEFKSITDLGKTRSGKQIHWNYNHPEHKDFNIQDHLDASDAHKKRIEFYKSNGDSPVTDRYVQHHKNQSALHLAIAKNKALESSPKDK
jgi:hypothetical protein